jgi:hypothetical protein
MPARSSRVIIPLLILVLAGLSVWAGWTYRMTERRVRDIDS